MSELQCRTNEEIEKKNFNHSFAKHTFGRRVQKYWNLLSLETRNRGIVGFKEEIKSIMIDDDWERLRLKMLNFGLRKPIALPPPSIRRCIENVRKK